MEEIAAGEAGFSLTFDPLSGAPMVSWGATSNKGGKTLLNFASKSNGSWVVTRVEPNGVLTERTSLAHGPGGRPTIVYHKYNGQSPEVIQIAPDGLPALSYHRSGTLIPLARNDDEQ